MLIDIAAIVAGLAILVWSADRFVDGAAALARNFGVSPMLIGLTIVGFGTSAPEIVVSAFAALDDNPGLAIGNALGSNIANIGLILGATALVAPLTVQSATLRREYPMLLAVTLGAAALMFDGDLDRLDGVLLLAALVLVLGLMIRMGMASRANDPLIQNYVDELPEPMSNRRALSWFFIGLMLLLVSSRLLVWGSVNIAQALGISDLVIGLTIVAFGTSLPELAAGIASALKKEHDLALGNIIGSNIYNLLAVLPMAALIAPGPFDPAALLRDMPVVITLTLALFVMGYGFGGPGRINRTEATVLVLAFVAYQGYLFYSVRQAIPEPTALAPLACDLCRILT